MRSTRTRSFRRHFARLPAHIQAQARATYRLFRANPHDPRVGFERIQMCSSRATAPLYATRIGLRYRAVARLEDGCLKWFFIGTHERYNGFL